MIAPCTSHVVAARTAFTYVFDGRSLSCRANDARIASAAASSERSVIA